MHGVARVLTWLGFAALFSAGIACAQGTTPKAKPSDYPAHAELTHATLAAEYLVHSIPTADGMVAASDYLVVEVAFFGPYAQHIKLSAEDFELRLNRQKSPLPRESTEIVAGSIKYPDWRQQHPSMTVDAGAGPAQIGLGHPAPVGRFPDDPNGPRSPRPNPIDPNAPGKEAPVPIEERVTRASLPEGEHVPPISGVLFFHYTGKIKSIRSLELQYRGPAGEATLKLF